MLHRWSWMGHCQAEGDQEPGGVVVVVVVVVDCLYAGLPLTTPIFDSLTGLTSRALALARALARTHAYSQPSALLPSILLHPVLSRKRHTCHSGYLQTPTSPGYPSIAEKHTVSSHTRPSSSTCPSRPSTLRGMASAKGSTSQRVGGAQSAAHDNGIHRRL